MHAWLENQIGQSAANIITSFVVLIIVIAAIAVTISILRKFNRGTFVVGGKSRTPRLSVRDAAAVDRTRRLVLVRRDNVEHLLMIGGPTDLVIETNIVVKEPGTNEESFISPKRNIAAEVVSTPAYREPLINEPLVPQNNVAVSPTPVATAERDNLSATSPLRSDINVAPVRSDVKVDPAARTFNRVSPKVNINMPPESVDLNRGLSTPPQHLHEQRMADFSASPTDRVTSQQAINPTIDTHFSPAPNGETVRAKFEGRHEPSLNIPAKSSASSVNLDDEFDHMFENELKDAIKNEKL